MDRKRLAIKVTFQIAALVVLLGMLLFLPAGSWHYVDAWIYSATIFVPITVSSYYLLFRDPEFLMRRMKTKEKESEQKAVKDFSGILFIVGYLVAGFDYRFGWSKVPFSIVITSNAIVLISFLLVFRVFKENQFASSTVEVEAGQRVISTGPYAIVRHPMYASVLPMYLFTPLALGSYWALIAFLPLPFLLVKRILNEEEVLLRELPGYAEYRQKVRWRMIPGVW